MVDVSGKERVWRICGEIVLECGIRCLLLNFCYVSASICAIPYMFIYLTNTLVTLVVSALLNTTIPHLALAISSRIRYPKPERHIHRLDG